MFNFEVMIAAQLRPYNGGYQKEQEEQKEFFTPQILDRPETRLQLIFL